jgi:hypothetical protein
LKKDERVVFQGRDLPMPSWRDSRDNVEVTQEPAREVEQMNSLVEELSAAR